VLCTRAGTVVNGTHFHLETAPSSSCLVKTRGPVAANKPLRGILFWRAKIFSFFLALAARECLCVPSLVQNSESEFCPQSGCVSFMLFFRIHRYYILKLDVRISPYNAV
jgi:hypothetical protein